MNNIPSLSEYYRVSGHDEKQLKHYLTIILANRKQSSDVIESKVSKADDRQGFVLPIPGAPFLAAAGAGAAASSIAVYGAYGDVIAAFLNSLLGEFNH